MTASGVVIVDKPRGPTSHDVVARLRRVYGTRQVGHAGTLDPLATGVLVALVGQGTKLSNYLTLEDKSYDAEVLFGIATDTLDAEGSVTRQLEVETLDPERLEAALAAERARAEQVPPAFSAIKVGGVRAHRQSRQGAPPELPPRPVRVQALELLALDGPRARIRMTVSKGYYVRSLARDLGDALNLPAHLTSLRRTASGRFTLDDASPWPLPEPPPVPMPVAEAARRALPVVTLTDDGTRRARLGQKLGAEHFTAAPEAGVSAWLDAAGELVALGEARDDVWRVVRGFSGP